MARPEDPGLYSEVTMAHNGIVVGGRAFVGRAGVREYLENSIKKFQARRESLRRWRTPRGSVIEVRTWPVYRDGGWWRR